MPPAPRSVVRFSVVRWPSHSSPGLSARKSASGKPAFGPDAEVLGRAGRQKGMVWVFASRSWIDPSSWGCATFPIGAVPGGRRPGMIISERGGKVNSLRNPCRPLQTHKTILFHAKARRSRGRKRKTESGREDEGR